MLEENICKKIVQFWMSFCFDVGFYVVEGVFLKCSIYLWVYGFFVWVLGKYSREEKLFSMEEVVRWFSVLFVKNFQLDCRGELKVGYFVDIVFFDLVFVIDYVIFEQLY